MQKPTRSVYQEYLDVLVKELAKSGPVESWQLWNCLAKKYQLGRRDYSELVENALADHWISRHDGLYYVSAGWGDE